MVVQKPGLVAIVLAAGKGNRMEVGVNKLFLKIRGVPILYRTLSRINSIELIDKIALVIQAKEKNQIDEMLEVFGKIEKLKTFINGGNERSDSVRNALRYIRKEGYNGFVMIHDGARPFFTEMLVKRLVERATTNSITLPALNLVETVRRIDNNGNTETLDRSQMFAVQTPQLFSAELIGECFLSETMQRLNLPDEASYFEQAKKPVHWVPGEKWNIKLTTIDDIGWAECLLGYYDELIIAGDEH